MDLDRLINNLSSIDFEAEQQSIVHENLDELSELQKKQFGEGIDGKSQPILLKDNAKYNYGYRPFTIQQKKLFGVGLGAVTDHITFYSSGSLYDNIYTQMNGNTFQIASHVPYWSVLMGRTQEQSNVLNEDNRRYFGETIVIPAIEKRLNEILK
jgi:hypothetical protein